MPVAVVTPPAAEPVTLEQAKAWLKIDFDAEDELIEMLISAAREKAEHYCNARFVTTTLKETFSRNSIMVTLAVGPNIVITEVAAGTNELVEDTDYEIHTDDKQTLVKMLKTYDDPLEITYTAGYGAATAVPKSIKQAILLTVADRYENRTDPARRFPTASTNLLNPNRRWIT